MNWSSEGWCTIFGALRDNPENRIETWDLAMRALTVETAPVLAEYIAASTAVASIEYTNSYASAVSSQESGVRR